MCVCVYICTHVYLGGGESGWRGWGTLIHELESLSSAQRLWLSRSLGKMNCAVQVFVMTDPGKWLLFLLESIQ